MGEWRGEELDQLTSRRSSFEMKCTIAMYLSSTYEMIVVTDVQALICDVSA